MEEWLVYLTERAVIIINGCALVVIAFGAVEAFVLAIGIVFRGDLTDERRTLAWLRFGRWLVLGLSFQLAADVIETSISPSWDEIGRFAAIALIRTFLNFFLDRDMEGLRVRQREMDEARRSAPAPE